MTDNFAPPLSKLSQSGIGVAAAPAGGMGLALDATGKLDGALLVDATLPAAKVKAEAFTAYNPAWTTTGATPALGNGTLTGQYQQFGKLVVCQLAFVAGTTTTFGGGAFLFSLPVAMAAHEYTGVVRMIDSSAGNNYGGLTFGQTTTTVGIFSDAQPGVTVVAAAPFAWATSDSIFITITYEAA